MLVPLSSLEKRLQKVSFWKLSEASVVKHTKSRWQKS